MADSALTNRNSKTAAETAMLVSTFAQVNLVPSLDWVLREVPVGEALEVHQCHLGTRNLHIREGIDDVWNETCGEEQAM